MRRKMNDRVGDLAIYKYSKYFYDCMQIILSKSTTLNITFDTELISFDVEDRSTNSICDDDYTSIEIVNACS